MGRFERELQEVQRKGGFLFTFELVPARASRGRAIDQILGFAREAAADNLLTALSITDNAGGHPALFPSTLGQEIRRMGLETIIHFSCKDRNRNTMESLLLELDRAGLRNLLVLTGDYPRAGYFGNAKPVFDLDSVHALDFIGRMNRGEGREHPSNFFPGCVVSPFKGLEAELVQQYAKLKKKLAAGARFVITQMGYDARKFHELRLFMEQEGLQVPLLGTVLMPHVKLARILYRGVVPGCVMPARLLERYEAEYAKGEEAGHRFRLHQGAKLMAILMGLGYQGAHISGPGLSYGDVARVVRLARELAPRYRSLIPEFLFPEEWQWWLFREGEGGLNSPERTPLTPGRTAGLGGLLHLGASRLVHWLAFEPGRGLHPVLSRMAPRVGRGRLERAITCFEYWAKGQLYDCRHCGDCTLGHFAFLCPQSQCAKFLLNGPCGGSRDGWCEVWPGRRRCFYVRIYGRLRQTEREEFLAQLLPPRNWRLYDTASWLNFYLGRDHRSAPLRLSGPGAASHPGHSP